MKARTIRVFLAAALLIAYTCLEYSDEKDTALSDPLIYVGIPYFSIYASSISIALTPSSLAAPVWDGIAVAGMIPSMLYLPNAGLENLAVSASLIASSYGLKQAESFYGDQSLFDVSNNMGVKYAYWTYYEGFIAAEKKYHYRSPNPLNDNLSFSDLVAAPWDPANLSRTQTWLPLALLYLGDMSALYLSTGGEKAVWATGKGYIGNSAVPLGVGLLSTFALSALNFTFTGIGEEAAFRGIGYDSMKLEWGVVPAKIIDAAAFASVHLPQDIAAGASLSSLAAGELFGAAAALAYQASYDAGGLRASVAEHMWLDTLQAVGTYLLTSGTSNAAVLSISGTVAF